MDPTRLGWLQRHFYADRASLAHQAGKPLLVEEYGTRVLTLSWQMRISGFQVLCGNERLSAVIQACSHCILTPGAFCDRYALFLAIPSTSKHICCASTKRAAHLEISLCSVMAATAMRQEHWADRDAALAVMHAGANALGLAGTLCWQLFAWRPPSSGDGYNFWLAAPGANAMRQQFRYLASKSAAASA
jgi:hypothetical protein